MPRAKQATAAARDAAGKPLQGAGPACGLFRPAPHAPAFWASSEMTSIRVLTERGLTGAPSDRARELRRKEEISLRGRRARYLYAGPEEEIDRSGPERRPSARAEPRGTPAVLSQASPGVAAREPER